jgi:hypothetical protein
MKLLVVINAIGTALNKNCFAASDLPFSAACQSPVPIETIRQTNNSQTVFTHNAAISPGKHETFHTRIFTYEALILDG